MLSEFRRLVLTRIVVMVIGAMATAAMCANSDPRLLAGMHDLKILPVATIVDAPDTVGLADSDLLRLATTDEIDKQLDMMQSIGITDVRIGLFWRQIEPRRGKYDWDRADYIINEANKRGMGVLAVLNETPRWAGTINVGTPSTADFAGYATAVAQRYKGKLSAVEIWNEPNARIFLSPVSPSNYTGLLKAGYTAIKAVDPSITVIGGVLGSTVTVGSTTMNPVAFVQGMYDAGAHGYFDALSLHPYSSSVMFSEQGSLKRSPLQQFQDMRALMDQYGDAAKNIWATEYGLSTSGSVTQRQQAEFIADFINSWGEQPGTGPIFLYTTRDLDTGSNSSQRNYGIWETDWTPKLAVQVLKDYLAGKGALPPEGNLILDAVRNFIVEGVKLVSAVVKGGINLVASVVKAVVRTAVSVVTAAVKAVVGVVKAIGKVLTGVVKAVVGAIGKVVGGGAAAMVGRSAAADDPVDAGQAAHKSATASVMTERTARELRKQPVDKRAERRAVVSTRQDRGADREATPSAATDSVGGGRSAQVGKSRQGRDRASHRDHRADDHGKAASAARTSKAQRHR